MSTLAQDIDALAKKRQHLHDLTEATWDEGSQTFDAAKAKEAGYTDIKDGTHLTAEIQRLNGEINGAAKGIETRQTDIAAKEANDAALEKQRPPQGTTKAGANGRAKFVDVAGEYLAKGWHQKVREMRYGSPRFDVDADPMVWLAKAAMPMTLKTVMSTGAGFAPEPVRTGDVVEIAAAAQPTTTLDFLPIRTVSTADVRFMRQTTRTNNAAEVAESVQGTLASAAESAEVYTEVTEPIRKINHFIPVTDEQLEDEAQVRALIETDLALGVRQRLNLQVLVGDGTAPNIEGFLDAGRSTNSQAKGVDSTPDAIYKAIVTNQFTARAVPDAFIVDPADWQDVRLLTTADGIYIFGPPSQAGEMRIWGLPVIQDTAITNNTGLIGAFRQYCYVAVRRGVSVLASSEHASFFIQGVVAMLAEMRAGLVCRREDAFTLVTGI